MLKIAVRKSDNNESNLVLSPPAPILPRAHRLLSAVQFSFQTALPGSVRSYARMLKVCFCLMFGYYGASSFPVFETPVNRNGSILARHFLSFFSTNNRGPTLHPGSHFPESLSGKEINGGAVAILLIVNKNRSLLKCSFHLYSFSLMVLTAYLFACNCGYICVSGFECSPS